MSRNKRIQRDLFGDEHAGAHARELEKRGPLHIFSHLAPEHTILQIPSASCVRVDGDIESANESFTNRSGETHVRVELHYQDEFKSFARSHSSRSVPVKAPLTSF